MTGRAFARDALVRVGLLPSRFTWLNPFKILEYEALLDDVTIRPTDVILDFGCGAGLQDLLLIRRAAKVVGIDIAPSQIERARALAAVYARGRALEFRCTPLDEAGFPPAHFDKIVSFSVLEHVAERESALEAIARVIRPGGLLILSTDSLATIRDRCLIEKHRTDHFVREYFTPSGLRRMLEAHGFGDVRVWPIFRSPYAARAFGADIANAFQYSRYRKFAPLVRLKLSERRHRRATEGIFLCARAVRCA